jgi:hypothetical protein
MTTQNTNLAKKVLLQSNLAGTFEVVTMPPVNLASNTFASANGALRLPGYPSTYPVSITSWTVFTGIAGVYRAVKGTVTLETYDHLRVYGGSGIDGPILYDVTSTASGTATEFNFVSGVNQTFTIAIRSDSSTTYANNVGLTVTGFLATNALSEVGEIRNDNGFPLAKDSTGTFALRQANLGLADVQVFTSNGTWTKPANTSAVRVFIIGGGGGGGSGRRDSTGLVTKGGGGGGAGGAVVYFTTMPISVFAATEAVVIGAGGTGGAGVSTNPSNGSPGSTGGTSTFSSGATLLQALGGGGGLGGTSSGTGGAGGSAVSGDFSTSGAGGTGASASAATAPTAAGTFLANGGGGGAGTNVSNTVTASASGASVGSPQNTTGTQTNAGVTTITAGSAVISQNGGGGIGQVQYRPKGGGGGGGGTYISPTAGNGGVGGNYGGGGGGGSINSNAGAGLFSGSGGNGADGIVIVVSW